jgi:DNA-binding GntR family transcriptional regulator
MSPDADSRAGSDLPARRANQKLADWIFNCLKDDVIHGAIRANHILVEGAVAERFGASRGPAREALQRLQRTSLVQALPRVGYLVSGISLRDFDEVFEMRLGLEPLATRLASQRIQSGSASPERLHTLANEVVSLDAAEADRGGRVAELNFEFHLEVAVLSGNRRLERTLSPLLDDMSRVMRILAYDTSAFAALVDDHPSLVEHMLNDPPKEAAALMRDQLERSYDVLRRFAIGTDITIIDR